MTRRKKLFRFTVALILMSVGLTLGIYSNGDSDITPLAAIVTVVGFLLAVNDGVNEFVSRYV